MRGLSEWDDLRNIDPVVQERIGNKNGIKISVQIIL